MSLHRGSIDRRRGDYLADASVGAMMGRTRSQAMHGDDAAARFFHVQTHGVGPSDLAATDAGRRKSFGCLQVAPQCATAAVVLSGTQRGARSGGSKGYHVVDALSKSGAHANGVPHDRFFVRALGRHDTVYHATAGIVGWRRAVRQVQQFRMRVGAS